METLNPASFMSSNPMRLFFHGSSSSTTTTEWTREENKRFESALAIFDETTPNRWAKVASMIPGKSIFDVIKQYKELEDDVSDIEAGRVPIPGYFPQATVGVTFPFEFEWLDDRDCFRKKPTHSAPPLEHERKKGVPWTKDEHRRFLLGLMKHGKGDWRSISRNFVITKTPTQVASHAQKYYLRQISGTKDKRRPSIHDYTVGNLTETTTPPDNSPMLFKHSSMIPPISTPSGEAQNVLLNWNIHKDEALMALSSTCGNIFMSSPYDIALNGQQNLYGSAPWYAKAHASMFEKRASRYHPL